jgi:AcrR family transcriptional regulator
VLQGDAALRPYRRIAGIHFYRAPRIHSPANARGRHRSKITPGGFRHFTGLDARGAKMPIPTKNSTQREKIVAAAAQLFARQGYHGTSTREIARLADVSENTIFRHFERKEGLFWSAVRTRCSVVKLRRDVLEGMKDGEAPEVILPKIIEFFSDILNYSPELLRLIAVALLEMQWKADIFCDEFLSPALSAISSYLAINVKTGRIRNLDPTMVTAALATMVLVHPWLSRHTSVEKAMYADSRAVERAYTAFWLDVLAPRAATFERLAIHPSAGDCTR